MRFFKYITNQKQQQLVFSIYNLCKKVLVCTIFNSEIYIWNELDGFFFSFIK